MKPFLTAAAILLLIAPAASSSDNAANPWAETTPPAQPVVYLSYAPNYCFTLYGTEYWIFVHSPDDSDFQTITLDISISGTWTTPPFVLNDGNAIVLDSDVSTSTWHFEILWLGGALEHASTIKLLFLEEPEWMGFQIPFNVTFRKASGAEVEGAGLQTFGGCCIDCFPCSVGLYADDSEVVIGRTSSVPFEWSWFCYATSAGELTVSDTEGWVSAWSPDQWGSLPTCGYCYVERHPGDITVEVPDGVAAGTTSELTISAPFGQSVFTRTITLEAIAPIPVETSTWGSVKALFD